MSHKLHNERATIKGVSMAIDTIEVAGDPNEGTGRCVITAHYFNDGEGIAIGLADPRNGEPASIVLSRADTVALYVWLREYGGFDHE